jgi:hypothetical protein
MKTLKFIEIKKGEETVIDATSGKELNTANLIVICLGQSRFKSPAEQFKAYDITKIIEAKEQGKDFELEDADFNFIKGYVEKFDPYLNGFTFMPFMELFK